jgi:hypothetical protein
MENWNIGKMDLEKDTAQAFSFLPLAQREIVNTSYFHFGSRNILKVKITIRPSP